MLHAGKTLQMCILHSGSYAKQLMLWHCKTSAASILLLNINISLLLLSYSLISCHFLCSCSSKPAVILAPWILDIALVLA